MEAAVMAKKRGPKAQPPEEQRNALIAVRCRGGFKAWLEEFAEEKRTTPSQLVELGLVEVAKVMGFRSPPKR